MISESEYYEQFTDEDIEHELKVVDEAGVVVGEYTFKTPDALRRALGYWRTRFMDYRPHLYVRVKEE